MCWDKADDAAFLSADEINSSDIDAIRKRLVKARRASAKLICKVNTICELN